MFYCKYFYHSKYVPSKLFSGQPGAHAPLFVDFDVLFCCKRQTVVGIILNMFGIVP